MWQVIGNEAAVESLARMVHAEDVPHALLITGPEGIGKTHVALELAKALNCVGQDPPCQTCVHCHQITVGTHPDVTIVERAEGKDSISIQQVRSLREGASVRPFQARFKVFVVTGAEGLTGGAADALLKTLEEPNPAVRLVLTALDADALPATVVSRCRVLALRPPTSDTLAAALIERGTEPEQARHVARIARGNVGWALRAAKQPKLLQAPEAMLDRLSRVLDMNLADRLKLAEDLAGDRKDRAAIRRHLEMLLLLGRDLLLIGQGLPAQTATHDQEERLRRQAQERGPDGVVDYLARVRVAMDRIDQNVDPRLTMEALFVSEPPLPRGERGELWFRRSGGSAPAPRE